MENKVKLLPHHIGVFSSFYFKNDEKRLESLEDFKKCGYSGPFVSNIKEIFYSIMENPGMTIEVTLEKPDSVCKPGLNEKCKECLLGRLLREGIAERMEKDENYKRFRRTANMLSELEELTFYPNLEPANGHKPKEFIGIVEDTGEKIRDLLSGVCFFPADRTFLNNIAPHSLKYKFLGNEKEVAEKFPLVSKFVDSKLEKLFLSPALLEVIIGEMVPDEKIKGLMEDYPKLFSDSEKKVYKEAMKIITS